MFIEIDTTSSEPIFEQLARQIRFAIAAGTIRASEMVTSVRELSKELLLNPNTVARAYRLLQEEGILESRRGMGLAVTTTAQETCLRERQQFFERKFERFLDQALASRLKPQEVRGLIDRIMAAHDAFKVNA